MKPAEERVGWRWRQHTVARTTRQGDASTGRVCGATFRAEVRSRIANPWEVRALRLRRALVDADNVYPIRVTGSASEIARLVPVNTRQWSCRKLTGGVGGGTPDVGGVTVGGEGGLGGGEGEVAQHTSTGERGRERAREGGQRAHIHALVAPQPVLASAQPLRRCLPAARTTLYLNPNGQRSLSGGCRRRPGRRPEPRKLQLQLRAATR